MRQLVHVAAFWIVVVVAVRLAVCFPRSALARALFFPLGPTRGRNEAQADFALRRARYCASWVVQAAVIFGAGCVALRWHASLADSPYFIVLWAVVVPMLGAGWLCAALFELARCVWLRRCDHVRAISARLAASTRSRASREA